MLSLLLVAAALPTPDVRTIPPRTVTWEACRSDVFDPRWILPRAPSSGAPDLVAQMKRLAVRRFEGDAQSPYRSFGDLVAACRDLRRNVRDREALFEEFQRLHPRATAAVGVVMGELLREDHVLAPGWDPDDDTGSDGFYFAAPWDVGAERTRPWRDLEGATELYQGATLVFADLTSFKAVENDFGGYYDHVGAAFREVRPIADSYVRGRRTDGSPFAALRTYFRCDLPFPFSGYEFDLHILTTLGADGHAVTDIYAEGRRFYWFAGRDVFIPVKTTGGEFVALLVVRQFGFDLKRVPDGDEERRSAFRSGLGSFKLRAERYHRERGKPAGAWLGAIPEFEVRGRR